MSSGHEPSPRSRIKHSSKNSLPKEFADLKDKVEKHIFAILKPLQTKDPAHPKRSDEYLLLLNEWLMDALNELVSPKEADVEALLRRKNDFFLNTGFSELLRSDLNYFINEFEHCRQLIVHFPDSLNEIPDDNIFKTLAYAARDPYKKYTGNKSNREAIDRQSIIQQCRFYAASFLTTKRDKDLPHFLEPCTEDEYHRYVVRAGKQVVKSMASRVITFFTSRLGEEVFETREVITKSESFNQELRALLERRLDDATNAKEIEKLRTKHNVSTEIKEPLGTLHPFIQSQFLLYLSNSNGFTKFLESLGRYDRPFNNAVEIFFHTMGINEQVEPTLTEQDFALQKKILKRHVTSLLNTIHGVFQQYLDAIILVETDQSYLSQMPGMDGEKGWRSEFERVTKAVKDPDDIFIKYRIKKFFQAKVSRGVEHHSDVGRVADEQETELKRLKVYFYQRLQLSLSNDSSVPNNIDTSKLFDLVKSETQSDFATHFPTMLIALQQQRKDLTHPIEASRFMDQLCNLCAGLIEVPNDRKVYVQDAFRAYFSQALNMRALHEIDAEQFVGSYITPVLANCDASMGERSSKDLHAIFSEGLLSRQLHIINKFQVNAPISDEELFLLVPLFLKVYKIREAVDSEGRKSQHSSESNEAFAIRKFALDMCSKARGGSEAHEIVAGSIEAIPLKKLADFLRPFFKSHTEQVRQFLFTEIDKVTVEGKKSIDLTANANPEFTSNVQALIVPIIVQGKQRVFSDYWNGNSVKRVGPSKRMLGEWKEALEGWRTIIGDNENERSLYLTAEASYKLSVRTVESSFITTQAPTPRVGGSRADNAWQVLLNKSHGLVGTKLNPFIKELMKFINETNKTIADEDFPKKDALLLFNTLCIRKALSMERNIRQLGISEADLSGLLSTNANFKTYIERNSLDSTKNGFANPNLDARAVASSIAKNIQQSSDIKNLNYDALLAEISFPEKTLARG